MGKVCPDTGHRAARTFDKYPQSMGVLIHDSSQSGWQYNRKRGRCGDVLSGASRKMGRSARALPSLNIPYSHGATAYQLTNGALPISDERSMGLYDCAKPLPRFVSGDGATASVELDDPIIMILEHTYAVPSTRSGKSGSPSNCCPNNQNRYSNLSSMGDKLRPQ